MNPHGSTGDFDCIPRGQRSPQLSFLIHVGLEVHMDAVRQDETPASDHIVKKNRFGLTPNPVQAWPVLHTEGEVESARTCDRSTRPYTLIARNFHHQKWCTSRPLVESRDVDRVVVRAPNELLDLGSREPAHPVARHRIRV